MSEQKQTLELAKADNERIQFALTNEQARIDIIAEVKAHIDAFVPDITTASGRKEIASIAYKVARTKTTIDSIGKDMVADAKAKIKVIDDARKAVRDTLDEMRDKVREPLTKYEQRIEDEKRIIAGWEATKDLTDIQTITETLEMFCGEMHQNTIEFMDVSLRPYAEQVKAAAITTLQANLTKAIEAEAEAKRIQDERAELDRLRKAEADRKAAEERERIQREATERAQKEAEAKAMRDIEDAQRRAAEAEQRAFEAEARANVHTAPQPAPKPELQKPRSGLEVANEPHIIEQERKRNNAMGATYFDILSILDRINVGHVLNGECAKQIVIGISDGLIANVNMEW